MEIREVPGNGLTYFFGYESSPQKLLQLYDIKSIPFLLFSSVYNTILDSVYLNLL
jgi:hypothetical protein